MKIKINSIWNNPIGSEQSFALSPTQIELFENNQAIFSGNVSITKLENTLLAKITGNVKIELPCNKCLKNIAKESPIEFNIEFSQKPDSEDENTLPIDKHWQINLTEPIRQEIVASIPSLNLCVPNCLGLCQFCGENLNDNTCKCVKVDYEVSNKINLPR